MGAINTRIVCYYQIINLIILAIKCLREREKYEELLTDILNLPFCLTQTDFEKCFDKISEDNFLSTVPYFNSLYEEKEEWAAAFRKDKFLLRVRTTQRVENTNKMLKSRISAQIPLNELFFRLMNLHHDLYNHDLSASEMDHIIKADKMIQRCPILEVVRDKISYYAQSFTLLNIFMAQSWQVSNNPITLKFTKVMMSSFTR